MARRPEDRFQSALAFAERLRDIQRELGFEATELVRERPAAPPVEAAEAEADPLEQTMAGPRPPLAPVAASRAGRPWQVPAAVGALVAVLLGGALGAHALLDRASRPAAAARPAISPAASPSVSPVASPALDEADRPTQLTALDVGASVVLHWQLSAAAAPYPLFVRQAGSGSAPLTLTAVQRGTRTMTLNGLDPAQGYCFTVGALVATGRPPLIAWSQPACIRGALPPPSPGG